MGCITFICIDKIINQDISSAELIYFDTVGVLGHLGAAMYTFDANVVILNVKAETRNPHKFNQIFNLAVFLSISLFMLFASICYYTYRADSQGIFTLTLPVNIFTIFLKIGVCFNALLSYPS
jgi:hypothetical protein